MHHRKQARREQNTLERHCMIARLERKTERGREQSSSAEPGTTKAAGVPSILKDFARSSEGRRRRSWCGRLGDLFGTSAHAAPLHPRGLAPRESEERANYRTLPTRVLLLVLLRVLDAPGAGNQGFAWTDCAYSSTPLPALCQARPAQQEAEVSQRSLDRPKGSLSLTQSFRCR